MGSGFLSEGAGKKANVNGEDAGGIDDDADPALGPCLKNKT